MKIKTKLYYEEDEGEFYWVRQSPIDPTFYGFCYYLRL